MKKLLLLLSILLLVSCSIKDEKQEVYVPQDGYNSLIKQTKQGDCVTFDSGLDINENNSLDENEITFSNQLCSVIGENGFNTLLEITKKDNCLYVKSGLDENRNGIIDDSEITFYDKICSETGETGDSGFNTLIDFVVLEVGAECTFGGTRVNYGLDTNRDNILQESEITGFYDICNLKCVKNPDCKYIVYDTSKCGKGERYSIWIDKTYFTNESLRFMSFADGSARLWGKVKEFYNEDSHTVDIYFTEGYEDDYKLPNCLDADVDPSQWIQYTEMNGTIVKDYTGHTYQISRRGSPTQFGIGANPTNQYLTLGFSGWFWATNHNDCKGDINIILEEECH